MLDKIMGYRRYAAAVAAAGAAILAAFGKDVAASDLLGPVDAILAAIAAALTLWSKLRPDGK